jgi:hypothetical protein
MYTPLKAALGADTQDGSGLGRKVAAGMLSGSLAAGISNPSDLIKTQMQKGAGAESSALAVLARTVRTEGVRGLWVGTTPSMARAALLTAAQCATYDELKLFFVRGLGWEDNLNTHFTGGRVYAGSAGLCVLRAETRGGGLSLAAALPHSIRLSLVFQPPSPPCPTHPPLCCCSERAGGPGDYHRDCPSGYDKD